MRLMRRQIADPVERRCGTVEIPRAAGLGGCDARLRRLRRIPRRRRSAAHAGIAARTHSRRRHHRRARSDVDHYGFCPQLCCAAKSASYPAPGFVRKSDRAGRITGRHSCSTGGRSGRACTTARGCETPAARRNHRHGASAPARQRFSACRPTRFDPAASAPSVRSSARPGPCSRRRGYRSTSTSTCRAAADRGRCAGSFRSRPALANSQFGQSAELWLRRSSSRTGAAASHGGARGPARHRCDPWPDSAAAASTRHPGDSSERGDERRDDRKHRRQAERAGTATASPSSRCAYRIPVARQSQRLRRRPERALERPCFTARLRRFPCAPARSRPRRVRGKSLRRAQRLGFPS